MPYRGRPVANFYNRSVYKTEFDIFKKNTDIDLISLASLEDDPKELDFLSRRCSSSRSEETKSAFQDISRKNKPVNRCVSARYPANSGQNEATKRKTYGRTCKSALGIHSKITYANQNRTSRPTTCGVRQKETSDLSSLNKRAKTNVDFKNEKHTPSVNNIQPNSVPRRQAKSAYSGRPRTGYETNRNRDSKPNSGQPNVRKRLKSAGSSVRVRSAISKKNTRVEFTEHRSPRICVSAEGVVKKDSTDGTRVEDCAIDTLNEKSKINKLESENDVNDSKSSGVQIESDDSGVVNDFSALRGHTPVSDNFVVEYTANEESKVVERIAVHSASTSRESDTPAKETHPFISAGDTFDIDDLIRNLVNQKVAETHLTERVTGTSFIKSDADSIFSVSEDSGDEIKREEVVKQLVEEPEQNIVQALHDIIMSKEAKSVIIETLYDLKGRRNRENKENYHDDIRFKSVSKQKRLKDNRNKYDQFMRERTETMLQLNIRTKEVNNHSEDDDDKVSYESDFEESIPDEKLVNKNKKLLPSIGEPAKPRGHTGSSVKSKHVYSLDQAKTRKYKIPGIGNYNLVASPDNDFEITPPGFDCRYDSRPLLTKEELDPPPKFIQERSIQKCQKWLKHVNLSPLSLNPVLNKR